LSHWFAQAGNNDYSRTHLETHTTAKDIALIKSLGFDHVRFTIERRRFFNEWDDPSKLNQEYLKYLDCGARPDPRTKPRSDCRYTPVG
jgi:beta-glucosidase/6-phospho-beta-glucosidase/beta-galactosidase